ncbi:MAG: helix-turn-helix domain-containing protein [Kineosporiaceae bacterium]
MDRTGLADFLRRRRDRIRPADVGLPPGRRRRAPGLRREEVAALAGMSVDYYTRLEQARGPHPSEQLLAALARALRLSDDERDHLFRLAGQVPPPRQGRSPHVRSGLMSLVGHVDGLAVRVVSDLGEVLAQNDLARALLGDPAHHRGRAASFYWRWFTDPAERRVHLPEDHERFSRVYVADLRATATRRRGDADVADLVSALLRASPDFARLWREHEVAVHRGERRKRVVHPSVGVLELDCEVLLTPEHDQLVIVYSAPAASPAAEQLRLVGVLGSQEMAPVRAGASPPAPRPPPRAGRSPG